MNATLFTFVLVVAEVETLFSKTTRYATEGYFCFVLFINYVAIELTITRNNFFAFERLSQVNRSGCGI